MWPEFQEEVVNSTQAKVHFSDFGPHGKMSKFTGPEHSFWKNLATIVVT